MGSNAIQGIIGAVVLITAAFFMYPLINMSTDQLATSLKPHCAAAGDQFTKIFSDKAMAATAVYNPTTTKFGGGGVAMTIGTDGAACAVSGTAIPGSGTATVYSNHGTRVGTATGAGAVTFVSGAKYVNPGDAVTRFAGLTGLVLNIIPIILVASFIGISIIKGYKIGTGQVSGGIVSQVMGIILVMVVVSASPTVIQAVAGAATASTTGAWDVNTQFSGLLALLFAFVVVVFIIGFMGYIVMEGRKMLQGTGSGG